MHPWHDLPVGDPAGCFQTLVEVPKGGTLKYELDKESGLLRLDRVLYSAVLYPANYGFLPRTLGDDGDPLDVLVLMNEGVQPLSIVRARAIGMLPMRDEDRGDEKIIAVCCDDPELTGIDDLAQLRPHTLRQIERFFLDYKTLENKTVEVSGYQDREAAVRVVREAVERYAEAFGDATAGG